MSEEDAEMVTDNNYETLAQIYTILYDKLGHKSIAMKKVLEKDFDINYSVPSNKCTLPDVVGRTALDFALDKRELEVFIMLIRHGANLTNIDENGTTILHRIIEKSYVNQKPCHSLKGLLEDPFVESVLSAQVETKNAANPYNQDGISHFHVACMFNHVEAVKFFLAQGVCLDQTIDRDSKTFPAYTPLHLAARYSALETVKLLLDHNAKINPREARGMCPLFLLLERNQEILDFTNFHKKEASEKLKEEFLNNEKMIRLLLQKSNDVKIALSHCQVACTLRDTKLLEQIIAEGGNLNKFVDKKSTVWPGYTALHFAALFNVNAVKLLLVNEADIIAKDTNGVTPFDLCLQRYSSEIIHSIVSMVPEFKAITFSNTKTKLADLILAMSDIATFKSFLKEKSKNINMSLPFNSPIWPGFTILHVAVILSDRIHDIPDLCRATDYESDFESDYKYHEDQVYFERVKLCLKMGADVTITDSFNSSPLHLAFRLQNRLIVQLLLEYHHKLINVVDSENLSHLHIACTVDQSDMPEKLLKTGIDVNKPIMSNIVYYLLDGNRDDASNVLHINPGWTCLHIAVAILNDKVVDVLIKYGADLYAKDSYGMTVIHGALNSSYGFFSNHHLSKLKYFSDQVTDFGLSHLHVACFDGDFEKVEDLIEHGADIEAKINYDLIRSNPALVGLASYDSFTPLHFALKERHLGIVKLLIKQGSNLFSQSANGTIPFYENLKNSIDLFDFDYLDYKNYSYSDGYNEDQSYYDDDEEHDECCNDDNSDIRFVLRLLSDKKIEDTIRKNSGITKLHVACLGLRRKMVIKLLKEGADPNAQIHADSPIWPCFTPLHLLIIPRSVNGSQEDFCEIYLHIENIGKQLLKHGASVTLKDAEGCTPIHKAPDFLWLNSKMLRNCYGLYRIRWLLDGYKNFNENPIDARGISHFDIACMSAYGKAAENFLKHGINVNRRFGHFSLHYGGFTALHLASLYKDDSLVDLLIKSKANYRAVDFLGNTPLHTAAVYCRLYNNGCHPHNQNIYTILLEAGAELEAKNLWDETPLAVILRMDLFWYGTLDILTKNQTCRINIFNLENEEGLLGVAIYYASRRHYGIEDNCFYKLIVKDPKSNDADEMGRTVIHNVVSIEKRYEYYHLKISSIEEYTRIINGFISLDFDIDCQDNIGQTALHKAVRFSNYNAVVGLLNNGANINIVDSNKMSAFSYYNENEEEHEDTCHQILEACLLHVYKLEIAELEISEANLNLVAQIRKKSISLFSERCTKELENLKKQKIAESYSITLYNILTETMNYFRMMLFLRDDIDKIFVKKIGTLHETYPEFAGLLLMQYRNIFIRLQLIDSAKSALNVLAKSALPDLCSDQIIKLLKNRDLKQLIATTQ